MQTSEFSLLSSLISRAAPRKQHEEETKRASCWNSEVTPAVVLELMISTAQRHIRSPVLSLAYAKHTCIHSSELPGSSQQLLCCQQLPPLHNILTLLSIFIFTQWGKSWRENTALQKLFTHAEDESDEERSKNAPKCTFVFLPPLFPLWRQLRQTQANISCYSSRLWAARGPEVDQIYIQPLIYICTVYTYIYIQSALAWIINAAT